MADGQASAGIASAGAAGALPARAAELLQEYVFHLSLVRAVSPRTVAAYRGDIRALLQTLSPRIAGPAQVTPQDLRAYLIQLGEKGRQPAGIARVRSAIRSFFAFLIDEGLLTADPSADLEAPAGWRRVPRALTLDQVARLLEATGGSTPLDMRDRALLEVAYGTGARASELLGLCLEDCGWEERLLRLTGKGVRVRLVPLGRPALAALRTYTEQGRPALLGRRKGGSVPGQVFLNARGSPLSRMGFWKILQRRAVAAGLTDGVHPHLLRHTYATHLLRGGASLRVVQELLGHARLATTQIYTSVDEAYLQEAHRRFHPRG